MLTIVFVMRAGSQFQYHESTIRKLCDDGHAVRMLIDQELSRKYQYDVAVASVKEIPGLSLEWSQRRSDQWRRIIFASREILNYASYLNRKRQSPFYRDRWLTYVPEKVRWALKRSGAVRKLMASGPVKQGLRYFERLIPSDRNIKDWLESARPDVVVASPTNMGYSEEVEYIKAAKALGIPTVVPVLSWDNLTTKGLFHVIPDLTLVWNQDHQEQATAIHDVPSDSIVTTGAPLFDKWFGRDDLLMSRAEFCERSGIKPENPYVVYLGSSGAIAEDETWLVQEIESSFRQHSDRNVNQMSILVRPHPVNAEHYVSLDSSRVVVWPRNGSLPDSESGLADFYNSLRHAVATVGVNTTAMVEAVVNDKSCITVLADQYKSTQMNAEHFRQLLESNVLEIASHGQDIPDIVSTLMSGEDSKRFLRRKFVEEFVRPRGINEPSGPLAALAIEMAAGRKTASQINSAMDSAILSPTFEANLGV